MSFFSTKMVFSTKNGPINVDGHVNKITDLDKYYFSISLACIYCKFANTNMSRLEARPGINQIYIVMFTNTQFTQASLLQKNQTLQNAFLIYVTLRWQRASAACKNQKLRSVAQNEWKKIPYIFFLLFIQK